MTYSEKLRDPRWQKRRLEIMQRDNFCCVHCGDTRNTLNVHHLAYERGRSPWDYHDSILITLCEDCHTRCENIKQLVGLHTKFPMFIDCYEKLSQLVCDGYWKFALEQLQSPPPEKEVDFTKTETVPDGIVHISNESGRQMFREIRQSIT